MRITVLALVILLARSSSAAIVETHFNVGGPVLTANPGAYSIQLNGGPQFGGLGGRVARVGGPPGRINTTAETGEFFGSAALEYAGGQTRMESYRFVTGPATFPDPPPTALWKVTVQTAWSAPSSMPVLSSTTAPLMRMDAAGRQYLFRPNIEVGIPDMLTLTGSYTVQGPSTTIGPIAFSHVYRPTGSLNVGLETGGHIRISPGSTFPAGTFFSMGYVGKALSSYEPPAPVSYTHTVDGASFVLNLVGTEVRLVNVPEPGAGVLLGIGVAFARRRLKKRLATGGA
jgi:hypothetical protein